MGVLGIFGAIFKGIGSSLVSIVSFVTSIEFFFGKHISPLLKIFRILGFIAFLSIFIQAVNQGVMKTEKPNFDIPGSKLQYTGSLSLTVLGEFATIFISVDNSIFTASKEFSAITNPVLWDVVKTFFKIVTRSFFYLWWFRIIDWFLRQTGLFGYNQSTGQIQAGSTVFIILTIFIIITNIAGMIYWQQLTFKTEGSNLGEKIKFFFDTNFNSAFDFFLVFIPYKGIIHYFIFNFGKSILLITGAYSQFYQPNLSEQFIENISNIT